MDIEKIQKEICDTQEKLTALNVKFAFVSLLKMIKDRPETTMVELVEKLNEMIEKVGKL